MVVRTIEKVLQFVRNCDPHGLIAIDGWDGSGKSTLARALTEAAARQHIELDTYLDRREGGYLDHLRYADLRQRLVEPDPPKVVEGVCVREVLARLGLAPAVCIYVKLLSSFATWHPDRVFEFESAGEAIAHYRRTLALYAQATGRPQPVQGLEEELIEYHFMWRPHEVSHLIFERLESDS